MVIIYIDNNNIKKFAVDSVTEGNAWLKAFKADGIFAAFIY